MQNYCWNARSSSQSGNALKKFDDLAFAYPNLAIAGRGLGDTKRAEDLFRKALPITERHRHRNLGPIMTDLADTLSRKGAKT